MKLLVAALFSCLIYGGHLVAEPVLTVCEALNQVPTLNGSKVQIRGTFVGTTEGSVLAPEDFVTCPQQFEGGGNVWLEAIALERDVGGVAIKTERARRTLEQSRRTLEQARKTASAGGSRLVLGEILRGRLEAPRQFVTRDGTFLSGYGNMGACPARLVYNEIVDSWSVPERGDQAKSSGEK